ncbi:hypothetical protein CgunFtcFv8_011926 [Champsocephalus gunnari]|uniref:Uncharacterized protein n=1 Tax=Champsocephalus gunnari TaxID=52237 RepID=A0AAN8DA60_CHAGU|nr:hypothetical protein CgunFtcFv8_011926 [Champsocephalus gunnari]
MVAKSPRRAASSLEPFWTGNHGDVGHAVMAERRLVAGGGVRGLQAAGDEGHKLSLYLGHWDAPAATSRQDAIMQEEGRGMLWAQGLIVTGHVCLSSEAYVRRVRNDMT